MADGNWSLGAYFDERATDEQTAALGAVFGGAKAVPWQHSLHSWRQSWDEEDADQVRCHRQGREPWRFRGS